MIVLFTALWYCCQTKSKRKNLISLISKLIFGILGGLVLMIGSGILYTYIVKYDIYLKCAFNRSFICDYVFRHNNICHFTSFFGITWCFITGAMIWSVIGLLFFLIMKYRKKKEITNYMYSLTEIYIDDMDYKIK